MLREQGEQAGSEGSELGGFLRSLERFREGGEQAGSERSKLGAS